MTVGRRKVRPVTLALWLVCVLGGLGAAVAATGSQGAGIQVPPARVELRENGTRRGFSAVVDIRGALSVSVDGGVATVVVGDGGNFGAVTQTFSYGSFGPTWHRYVCSHAGYGSSADLCTGDGDPPGAGSMTVLGSTGGSAVVIGAGWQNEQKRLLHSAGVSANTWGGQRFSVLHLSRRQGFVWQTRYGVVVTHSGQRAMEGLYGAAAAPIVSRDPSWMGGDGGTLGNVFYVGADAADTNLECCTHGAADGGQYSCTTLGSNFPKALFDAGYDITLSASPGNSDGGTTGQVECNVCSRAAGVCTTLVLTNDLPTDTALMTWLLAHNNGASGSGVSMNYMHVNVAYGTGP